MVRQKISKNSKRNRASCQEDYVSNKLRDFEIMADSMLHALDVAMNDEMHRLSRLVQAEKARISKHILQMTIGDMRHGEEKTIAEISAVVEEALGSGDKNILSTGGYRTRSKYSRTDEGYQTEDNSAMSVDIMASARTSSRPMGPLASAIKGRRRSKSALVNRSTPAKQQPSALLLGLKPKPTPKPTPNVTQNLVVQDTSRLDTSQRLSRSKLRTPVTKARMETVSADRGLGMIAMKVQPNTPLAIMRHARAGEPVYSVTGSPVFTFPVASVRANVNIPVSNGILSIRPNDLDTVETSMLPKIDIATLEELKKLQENLDKIMQFAEECNFHMT